MFSTIHVPSKVFPIALTVMLGLTGCGGGGGSSSSATTTTDNESDNDSTTTTSNLTGSVMGGIAPVTGSTVVLWAANDSGSQAIAKTTTDTEGSFSLSYTNPGGSYLLYVTAYQGDDGAGTNDQIQMVASIGSATSVHTSTTVTINELTTVAFTMSFGVSYTGANGLVGATVDQASWAASMVNVSDGTLALTTNGILIQALNFTANLLASCYQTDGTNGVCDDIKSASGEAASMFLAAVYWATNTVNVDWETLAGLIKTEVFDNPTYPISDLIATGEPPQPVSVTLTANGNALIQPKEIAIDGFCNVWVGSDANPGYLSEIQTFSQGMPSVVVKEYDSPNILVGDGSGGIYYNNNNGGAQPQVLHLSKETISTFTSSQSLDLTIDTGLNGTFSSPISALAYDPLVPSIGGSTHDPLMVESAGFVCETGLVNNVCYIIDNPGPMAAESQGNIFVADLDAQAVVEIPVGTADGSAPPHSCDIGTNVTAMAVDSQGHVWVTGEDDSVIKITDVQACVPLILITNEPKFFTPEAIAVDGSDNIWVANKGNDTVVKVHQGTGDTVDITTYSLTSGSTPVSITVDPMGNVWTANNGNNSVTGLFGVASPVGQCTPPGSGSSTTTVWSVPAEDMNWDPTISTILGSSGSIDSGSSSGGNTLNWLDYLPTNSSGLVDPYGILN